MLKLDNRSLKSNANNTKNRMLEFQALKLPYLMIIVIKIQICDGKLKKI